jgi:hypothetical protein
MFFLRLLVLQLNFAAARKPRFQQNQRAVRINCQCFRLFLYGFSLGIGPAYTDGNLHQHPLTPASNGSSYGRIRALRHANLTRSTIPRRVAMSSSANGRVSKSDNGPESVRADQLRWSMGT